MIIEMIRSHHGLTTDAFDREFGSFAVDGYLVGRRLLKTEQKRLDYSSSDLPAAEAAEWLVARSMELDPDSLFDNDSSLWVVVSTWAEFYSAKGMLGELSDREAATQFARVFLMGGLLLAVAEQERHG